MVDRIIAAFAALFIITACGFARAQGVAKAEPLRPPTSAIVPELKVSASTAAEAEAMLDGNVFFAAGRDVDVQIQPLIKIKTKNGLGQIFGTSEQSTDSPTWRAGLASRFVFYNDGMDIYRKNKARADSLGLRQRAFAACRIECRLDEWVGKKLECANLTTKVNECVSAGSACLVEKASLDACTIALAEIQKDQGDKCKPFVDHYKKGGANYKNYGPKHMCEAGVTVLKLDMTHPMLLPPFALSGGVAFGSDLKTYFDNSDPENMKLVEDERHSAWKVSARATHVFSRWVTLEYGLEFAREVKDRKRKGRACDDQGVILEGERDVDPPAEGNDDDVDVDLCREEVLGAPTRGYVLTPMVEYGIVGEEGLGWRVSMGPKVGVRFPDDGDASIESLAWRVPIALEAISLPKAVSGDVKGLLRIVPYIENAAAKDELGRNVRDWRFAVNFELLAQRTLFSSVAPDL